MPLGQTPEQEITACDLIEIQRILACSKNPFERLVGALLVAGMLDVRPPQVTDRRIGQLKFDHFRNYLGILLPESTIGGHATRRLLRPARGKRTTENTQRQ